MLARDMCLLACKHGQVRTVVEDTRSDMDQHMLSAHTGTWLKTHVQTWILHTQAPS